MSCVPNESPRIPVEVSSEPAAAPQFAERALQIFNDGCLALLISVGHQTGLFDVMATLPPATSAEIAMQSGLHERYVREWLGGMAVGRIVRYDPALQTYFLPPEHAALLTRAAGGDNFAAFMQYVSLMGNVEKQVVHAFRKGGGVPYSAYEGFQELQGEESRQTYSVALVQHIIPLDPEVEQRLRNGIDVADIGTGAGNALLLMAQAFPASRFTGFDLSEEGVSLARASAAEMGVGNVEFAVRDIATLDFQKAFDLVTAFDVIHDLAKPRQVLRRVAQALREGGAFMMVDIAASSHLHENIDHPLGPALFTFSTMHCMTVSLAQGGEGLGTVWGEQKARELLLEAGFRTVDIRKLEGDVLHTFYFARL